MLLSLPLVIFAVCVLLGVYGMLLLRLITLNPRMPSALTGTSVRPLSPTIILTTPAGTRI
jgi:hypothetical protein